VTTLRREDDGERAAGTDASGAVLAVPEGWSIDPITRARLACAFDRVGPEVVGVVARRADLPAGTSYRVHAERGALEAPDLTPAAGPTIDGAVILRDDAEYAVGDDAVTVAQGWLLVDPGAVVHDPWRRFRSLEDASPLGRPPFPWRPVVVFLGFDRDPDLADWVRALVNNLVRASTEGRIAVPEPTAGLHLTRPCAPTEASVTALRPDVLVALDDDALARGSEWLGGDRSAVVVQLTQETSDLPRIVPWRIGVARGRLRAQIGRGIKAAAFADLVRRLCAGPQPLPPSDGRRHRARPTAAPDRAAVPIATPRRGRAEATAASAPLPRAHVLHLLHSRPGDLGGTDKHFAQLIEALGPEIDSSVLQPVEGGYLLSTRSQAGSGASSRQEYLVARGESIDTNIDNPVAAEALRTALDMFDFHAVHIQNILHHSLAPLTVLADFPGPVTCSVRDLYLACPNHWLLYRNERSCGIPDDLAYCARCLPETRGIERKDLERFRAVVAARLDTVDHWVFASQSSVDFLLRVYDVDPARIHIIEHGAIIDERRRVRDVDVRRVLDEPMRIAFVGIGWAKKGLKIVNDLADALAGGPVEFHHFGELRDRLSPNVVAHGTYDNRDLPDLLDRAGIQIVMLPGPFVETFGHVMTEAIIAGRPVIVSRWGALGERVRRHEVGWTTDPEDPAGTRELVLDLERCRDEVLRATRRAVTTELRSIAATAPQYAALYRSRKALPRTAAPPRGPIPVDDKERLQHELRTLAAENRRLHAELVDAQTRAAATRGATSRRLRRQFRRVRDAIARHGVLGAARQAVRRTEQRLRRSTRR
jgi:glycosyltransferase involved in cell wall biosynthesis